MIYDMAKIRFLPENKIVQFEKNITVIDTAFQNGIYIPSQCEEGTCATCMVNVKKGREFLLENGSGFKSQSTSGSILACVSTLKEDVEDEIIIEIEEY